MQIKIEDAFHCISYSTQEYLKPITHLANIIIYLVYKYYLLLFNFNSHTSGNLKCIVYNFDKIIKINKFIVFNYMFCISDLLLYLLVLLKNIPKPLAGTNYQVPTTIF